MFYRCPGTANLRTLTIKIKRCPECGKEVEIFSDEMRVKCDNCGFMIYNDLQSCVQWCRYAKQCVGEEVYNKLRKKRIAFVCVENACRSQIAEALAEKLCDRPDLEFVSGGTHPADEVDRRALEVLQEEGIEWRGKPKAIPGGPIDIVVTMGCDVVCPFIPGAKKIDWDIPDPKGKDIEEYRKVLKIIKEKVTELLKEVE
jgi:protein-tyrosine-phosphatase/ribosomal protein S27AE